MLLKKTIPFGEWLPDQPALGNGVTVVKNCIPNTQSYRSIGALSSISDALDTACIGAAWAKDSTDAYFNFAGDAGKLYRLSAATFTDKSKSGGYTATSWEFAVWGDRVIASSIEEPMQYFDMATSSLFADLPGSPPQAKHIAIVRDFVVTGNVDEGGTVYPNRVRWSGYNNSELWTSSQATQSDFQDLQGRGGEIKKIVPGETGLIFQEHAIRRMTYVGPPLIFRIDEIERDRGCYAPNSVVWTGDTVFYYSHDGFYMKQGDNVSTPIGAEKIDRYISKDFDASDINAMRGAVDRRNKLVVWCFPSLSKGANQVLAYRWDVGRWSLVDQHAEYLLEQITASYTLDDLDTVLADIDSASISVDSDAYLGGVLSLGAFNSDHELSTFDGAALDAEIETGELMGTSRASVKSVRPLSDGTTAISAGTRDNQNDNYTYGASQDENVKGEMNFRTSARYHRFKAVISDGFDNAQGVEVIYRQEGRR